MYEYTKSEITKMFSKDNFNTIFSTFNITEMEYLTKLKVSDFDKYEKYAYKGSVVTYEQAKYLSDNGMFMSIEDLKAKNNHNVFKYIAYIVWSNLSKEEQYDRLLEVFSSYQSRVISSLNRNQYHYTPTDMSEWIGINGWKDEIDFIIFPHGWSRITFDRLCELWRYEISNNAETYLNGGGLKFTNKIETDGKGYVQADNVFTLTLFKLDKEIYQVMLVPNTIDSVENFTISSKCRINPEDVENFFEDLRIEYADSIYLWRD